VLPTLAGVRDKFCIAEGGRFDESWRWREVIPALFDIAEERPALPEIFEADARWFDTPFATRFIELFTGALPARPVTNALLLIVCTGKWDAPAAGVVRAITARFCTADDGVLTRALAFAEPMKLCFVGEKEARFETCAPLRDAAVTCAAPRLIA